MRLYDRVGQVLTNKWQTTPAIQHAVGRSANAVPAIHDVAAMLRQLRRDGVAERVSQRLHGHVWRRAGSTGEDA